MKGRIRKNVFATFLTCLLLGILLFSWRGYPFEFSVGVLKIDFDTFYKRLGNEAGGDWIMGFGKRLVYFDKNDNKLVVGRKQFDAGDQLDAFVARDHVWFAIKKGGKTLVMKDSKLVGVYGEGAKFKADSRGERYLFAERIGDDEFAVWLDGERQEGIWTEVHYFSWVGRKEVPQYAVSSSAGTVIVHDGKSYGPYDAVDKVYSSDLGDAVAFEAFDATAKKWSVVSEGKKWGGFDRIDHVSVSAKGDRIGFTGRKGGKLIVFDGEEKASRFASIEQLQWFSDGTLSYIGRKGPCSYVVVGSRQSRCISKVFESRVAGDERISWVSNEGKQFLYVSAKEGETQWGPYDSIKDLVIGSLAGHYAATVQAEKKQYVVLGGQRIGPLNSAARAIMGPGPDDAAFFGEKYAGQYSLFRSGKVVWTGRQWPRISWMNNAGQANALIVESNGFYRHLVDGRAGKAYQFIPLIGLNVLIHPNSAGLMQYIVYDKGMVRRVVRWDPRVLISKFARALKVKGKKTAN